MKKKSLFIGMCLAGCLAAAAPPALEVYPAGEKPGLALPVSAKEPLEVELARGESDVFFVRWSAGDVKAALRDLHLAWSGRTPQGIGLRAFWAGAHHLKSSSFRARPSAGEVVDPLVPNEWILEGRFQPPIANLPSRPVFLIELLAGPEATAGSFEGRLEFRLGEKKESLALRLRVHEWKLPDRFDLPASFGYSPWEVMKKHYGGWSAAGSALDSQYHSLALEHRLDLHKIYVQFPGPSAKDPLTDAKVPEQSFLRLTRPLFEGPAVVQGHRLEVTDLPVPPEMKKLPPEGSKAEESVRDFWRSLDASVVRQDWRERTFVYYADEPSKKELPGLAADLKRIKKWAPHLRFLVTAPYRPVLDGAVDIWCVNLIDWDKAGEPTPASYLQRQQQGRGEFWFYVSCNSHGCSGAEDTGDPDLVMDRPSSYQRSLPWVALRYGARGLLYYDTVYGYGHGGPGSPWQDGFHFTGYGEGNLFYPCTLSWGGCKEPRVLPSVRLKILRDGLEDAQILTQARARGAPVDEWLKKAVPDSREALRATRAFEEIKREALRFLDRAASKAGSNP